MRRRAITWNVPIRKCYRSSAHQSINYEPILFEFVMKIQNKKVLLRERKRHTARRVASTRSTGLRPGDGQPPSSSGQEGSPHLVLLGGLPHPVIDPGAPPPPILTWDLTWLGGIPWSTSPGRHLRKWWLAPWEMDMGPVDGSIMGWRWGYPMWTDRRV